MVGILYQNVTPAGASAFTTLTNVVIEKAGHFEPCFGDCSPTPFGGLRYYNQSTQAVTFDSIVVRLARSIALDVQPPGTGGLSVLRSQFYANPHFPMIQGPETPGNGAKLKVQFSDLYAYNYQAISSIYTGGAADTVDATATGGATWRGRSGTGDARTASVGPRWTSPPSPWPDSGRSGRTQGSPGGQPDGDPGHAPERHRRYRGHAAKSAAVAHVQRLAPRPCTRCLGPRSERPDGHVDADHGQRDSARQRRDRPGRPLAGDPLGHEHRRGPRRR